MAVNAPLLTHIHRLVAPAAAELGCDAELLRKFVDQRDQSAFAGLVARHGPMVLRLCRRVLGDSHAAEDACQAAFLVLARKAASIRHPETLGAWLHGVAYRLALKARAADVRRRQIETQHLHRAPSGPTADPLSEVSGRELLTILDAELQRLPERYRLPLVLCCLEGRSQPEAAQLLGWSPGSVKGRLERARAKLHGRLLRRGLSLPAALLALETMQGNASARLPVLLHAAILRTASTAATARGISTAVLDLAEGSAGSMAPVKLKLASVVVLMIGALAGSFAAFVHPQLPAQKDADKQPAAPPARHKKTTKQSHIVRKDRYGDPLPPGVLARLGTIRLRRAHDVFALPQHDAFLSVSPDQNSTGVSVWRMSTGERLRHLELPLQRVTAAVFPDGKKVALSAFEHKSGTKTVFFYDLSTGKKTGQLRQAGLSFALGISADGKMIATEGDDRIVRLWDAESGTEIRRCQATNKSHLNRLVFSPDGKILASASLQERTVHLWDTVTGKELRVLSEGPGLRCSIVFSPDGKTVAEASGLDKTVRLWDAASGKIIRQFRGEMGIYSLAFSPDGKILAAGETPERDWQQKVSPIHLWDANTGKEVRRLTGHVFTVASLAFSADGKWLISGSSSAVVRVWDVETGKEALPFEAHESFVESVAFSPDGRSLATGSLDGTIRLWEPMSGKAIRVFEGGVQPQVTHLAFAPDGRTLVSDQSDGSLRIWNVATGRQTRRLQVGKNRHMFPFDFSPDGRTLAVWHEDGGVRLLDAASGKERRRLAGEAGNSAYLRFSPDSSKLAVQSFSFGAAHAGHLHVWDTATGNALHKWKLADAGPIVFSPDSQTLLGGTGDYFLSGDAAKRTFHVLNVNTGEDRPLTVPQAARLRSLAISPDGRTLAWGDSAGIVTLWERTAERVRRRLNGHCSKVEALAFSPDGKTLASGGADATALVWDVSGMPLDRPALPLDDKRLSSLWDDLAGKEAGKAFDAIGLLTAAPERSVAFLKHKMRPAPQPAERRHVARLIADLDSEEFAVRDKAMQQLRQLGERAELGLREALQNKPALEARKRIEELQEGIRKSAASAENLRNLRAVEVLEHIGTPETRGVLKTLANGAAEARLTREAKAALKRLTR